MSASSSPTFAPDPASATATLTATVVLPTPPLPDAMATTLRAVMCSWLANRVFATTFASHLRLTPVTPGTAPTAARASLSITPRSGQAGVVSTIVKLATPFSTFRSLIMLSVTRSLCSSGSCTVDSARITCSGVAGSLFFLNIPAPCLSPPKNQPRISRMARSPFVSSVSFVAEELRSIPRIRSDLDRRLVFQIGLDVLLGFLVQLEQRVVVLPEPGDRLLGAGRAAAHGPVRVRVAGQAAVQADHHQPEGQRAVGAVLLLRDLLDEVPPRRAAQILERGDHARGEKHFCVALIHACSP